MASCMCKEQTSGANKFMNLLVTNKAYLQGPQNTITMISAVGSSSSSHDLVLIFSPQSLGLEKQYSRTLCSRGSCAQGKGSNVYPNIRCNNDSIYRGMKNVYLMRFISLMFCGQVPLPLAPFRFFLILEVVPTSNQEVHPFCDGALLIVFLVCQV